MNGAVAVCYLLPLACMYSTSYIPYRFSHAWFHPVKKHSSLSMYCVGGASVEGHSDQVRIKFILHCKVTKYYVCSSYVIFAGRRTLLGDWTWAKVVLEESDGSFQGPFWEPFAFLFSALLLIQPKSGKYMWHSKGECFIIHCKLLPSRSGCPSRHSQVTFPSSPGKMKLAT